MPQSVDETRRDFLVKLARTAVFVPPLMATVALGEAEGAVKKVGSTGANSGSGTGAGTSGNQGNGQGNTIGGVSPTAQQVASPSFSLSQQQAAAASESSPWAPGAPSDPPPWSAPPPAQTGG